MFLRILGADGKTHLERDLPARQDAFLEAIDDLERSLVKTARIDNPVTMQLLRTVPGIGKILRRLPG